MGWPGTDDAAAVTAQMVEWAVWEFLWKAAQNPLPGQRGELLADAGAAGAGLGGFPDIAAAVAPQQGPDLCPSVPLLVTTGAEVAASQGDIAFTAGDTAPFVIQVFIVPITALTLGAAVLAGPVLNGWFGLRPPRAGFSTPSVTVVCELLKWDPLVLPAPAKGLSVKRNHIPAHSLHGGSSFPRRD